MQRKVDAQELIHCRHDLSLSDSRPAVTPWRPGGHHRHHWPETQCRIALKGHLHHHGQPVPSWRPGSLRCPHGPAITIMALRGSPSPSWPDTFLSPLSRGEPCLQLEQHVLLLISLSSGAFDRSLTRCSDRALRSLKVAPANQQKMELGRKTRPCGDAWRPHQQTVLNAAELFNDPQISQRATHVLVCFVQVDDNVFNLSSNSFMCNCPLTTRILFYDWTLHDARVQKITFSLASIRVATFTQRVVSITCFIMGRMSVVNEYVLIVTSPAFTRLQRFRLGTRFSHHIF